jgi:hypothetical protein
MVRFNGDDTWRQHRHKARGAFGVDGQCLTPAIKMPWLSRLVEDERA